MMASYEMHSLVQQNKQNMQLRNIHPIKNNKNEVPYKFYLIIILLISKNMN